MQDLIWEYHLTLQETRRILRVWEKEMKHLQQIELDTRVPKSDRMHAGNQVKQIQLKRSILAASERDLVFSLEWMESGRAPGNRRGIERRAAYQREVSFDPSLMQKIFEDYAEPDEWESLSEEDLKPLDEALSVLTDKEREAYWLYKGLGISQYEVAKLLHIGRTSAQSRIQSAERKLAEFVKNWEGGTEDGVCAADSGPGNCGEDSGLSKEKE